MNPSLPVPTLGPILTASLNLLSTILLLAGWIAIRRGQRDRHRRIMLGALGASAAFLAVYLAHHAIHGSTRYPFHDWTYAAYLLVLIPHSILAGVMVPFILRGVWLAAQQRFAAHRRLMRCVWPVWFYVSLTGIVVFLMLYVLPHAR